jgi:hypothetical protein
MNTRLYFIVSYLSCSQVPRLRFAGTGSSGHPLVFCPESVRDRSSLPASGGAEGDQGRRMTVTINENRCNYYTTVNIYNFVRSFYKYINLNVSSRMLREHDEWQNYASVAMFFDLRDYMNSRTSLL